MDNETPPAPDAPYQPSQPYQPYPSSPSSPAGDLPVADLVAPPPRRRRRPWIWAVAIVVIIAVPAAFVATSSKAKPSPLAVLSAASGQTKAAGTARVSMTEKISEFGDSMTLLNIDGATDWAHKINSLSMTSQGVTGIEIRQLGDITYMSSPLVTLPHGAQWVSVDPKALHLSSGQSPLGNNDPSSGLNYLNALKGDPKVVGPASIDGTDTTRYRFTIDIKSTLDRAKKGAAALGEPGLGSSLDQLDGVIDLTKIPAQAWIDHDGRVRRFEFTLTVPQGEGRATVVCIMDFSHFDEPVHVAKPSASETVPFSQVPDFFTQMSSAGQTSST